MHTIEECPYNEFCHIEETRDEAKFGLLIRSFEEIYGGDAAVFKVSRNDVDEEEDAPVMEKENATNTQYESHSFKMPSPNGVRMEGEFWRDEWIKNNGSSERVRGDDPAVYPSFVIETDGSRALSNTLNSEGIGRWLWFSPTVVEDFLKRRGFELEWYTNNTGGLISPCKLRTHFGVNDADLVVVYAYDIARLPRWEQQVWATYSVTPEGGIGNELKAAQVQANPANTIAPEIALKNYLMGLDGVFIEKFGYKIFSDKKNIADGLRYLSRFSAYNNNSLLTLAKNLNRVFVENIDKSVLRKIVGNNNDKLGSIKLFESLVARYSDKDTARSIFSIIIGVYELRIGDAHRTSSDIEDAFKLAWINRTNSYLKQAKQLINNYANSIQNIGYILYHNA